MAFIFYIYIYIHFYNLFLSIIFFFWWGGGRGEWGRGGSQTKIVCETVK